jgi:hypothetical protein
MNDLKQAIPVFKDYYACPECKDAIYNIEAFTHREYECKDCRQVFLVPSEVKINKPKEFRPRPDSRPFNRDGKKPEFKRGE